MPPEEDIIKNIACVKIGDTEICNEEPIGKPSIKKTLIGNGIVTQTGEYVQWLIEVQANGGDIIDFSIVDKLPPELEYSSYTVKSKPSSITIKEPTGIGTKRISWEVVGTLKD